METLDNRIKNVQYSIDKLQKIETELYVELFNQRLHEKYDTELKVVHFFHNYFDTEMFNTVISFDLGDDIFIQRTNNNEYVHIFVENERDNDIDLNNIDSHILEQIPDFKKIVIDEIEEWTEFEYI
jgi:hypothetical protein